MSTEQKEQIRNLTRQPITIVWRYWPFLFPVIIVIVGIAIQVVLLGYFKSKYGDLDILIRRGDRVTILWSSDLVREAVLTTSFSITITFGLLAFLARRCHQQAVLLKAAAKDLGIESGEGEVTENAG